MSLYPVVAMAIVTSVCPSNAIEPVPTTSPVNWVVIVLGVVNLSAILAVPDHLVEVRVEPPVKITDLSFGRVMDSAKPVSPVTVNPLLTVKLLKVVLPVTASVLATARFAEVLTSAAVKFRVAMFPLLLTTFSSN